jgi:hypothetical protein
VNLSEILLEKKEPEGTYVGVSFSRTTQNAIRKMMKDLKVPSPISRDKMHSTIIYSRKYFKYEPLGDIDPPWIGTPTEFDIFDTRDGKKGLVLKYECKDQRERHEYLMDTYKAKYDFPEYKIHLTLTYDAGEFKVEGVDPKQWLPQIEIVEEYSEDLQLDWLANKDKPKEA